MTENNRQAAVAFVAFHDTPSAYMRVLRQDLSTEQDTLAEQQADLFWAVDTLTGRGDLSDSSDAATNMLGQLVADGCVPAVRVLAQSALLYLAQDTLPDPKGKQ